MTMFKAARTVCGLSQTEAASYLGVSIASVKSWDSERRNVPAGVWDMMANLFQRIQDAADFAADHMAENGIDPRAFQNLDADSGDGEPLPEGSARAAGAMALMMALETGGPD